MRQIEEGDHISCELRSVTVARPLERQESETRVKQFFQPLREILRGIFYLREQTAQALDKVMAFGERLSASLIAVRGRKRVRPWKACPDSVIYHIIEPGVPDLYRSRLSCPFLAFLHWHPQL